MSSKIYVDWSGDPGFRFRRGSSELLIVAAVTSAVAELDVSPLRTQLALSETYEFHFAKTEPRIRESFRKFLEVKPDFSAAVALRVHKQMLHDDFRSRSGEQLIADFISMCMKFLPLELVQDAALIYDGRKEQKSFRRILRTTLSETLKPDIFLREVKAVPAS